jgi:signal transduction histidine kinase
MAASGEEPSVASGLGSIMRSALTAADGDLALVALRVDEKRLVIQDAVGPLAEDMVGNLMLIEETVLGPVLLTGRPLLVTDYPVRGAAPPSVRRRIGSVIMAPLRTGQRSVTGVLAIGRLVEHPVFGPDDLDRLVALVQASTAAREVEVAHAERRLARLVEERARIRDDLHDNVIQEIFAASMALQSIAERLADSGVAGEIVRQVQALDATTERIRGLISDLPTGRENPESMPLPKRLVAIVDSVTAALRCLPVVRFIGPVDAAVSGELALDLEAVLREALSNVARHAAAGTVEVRVTVGDGRLVLDVVDDGRGLGRPTRRSGLNNMARRAQRHGGALRLSTPERGGTRLSWDVPLP